MLKFKNSKKADLSHSIFSNGLSERYFINRNTNIPKEKKVSLGVANNKNMRRQAINGTAKDIPPLLIEQRGKPETANIKNVLERIVKAIDIFFVHFRDHLYRTVAIVSLVALARGGVVVRNSFVSSD